MLALKALDECINVDIDSIDQQLAKRVEQALGYKAHDATSNPIVIKMSVEDPSNRDLLVDSIKQRYAEGGWEGVYDHFAVRMIASNKANLQGRVLFQLSPRHVKDRKATVKQGRNIAREFELLGLSRDDFTCKVMISGPTANACKELAQEGITTLGTTIFTVTQAIAASQAGCLYISPYYNESAAAQNPAKYWPNKEDPALEHPMSPRVIQIVETYKRMYRNTGTRQPLVKLAGFIGYKEAVGAAEMGCHSVTCAPKVLEELMATDLASPIRGHPKQPDASHYSSGHALSERLEAWAKTDPLGPADWNGELPNEDVNYLADNGKAVDLAVVGDATGRARWTYSVQRHGDCEKQSGDYIEKVAKEVLGGKA